MRTEQCNDFALFLEQEPDGPLSDAAAGHLDGCSNCQLLWNDLESIRTASMDWGVEHPEPPARLWANLRAQLESEGLIRDTGRSSQPSLWLSNWFGLALRPALAGAALSLFLVASSLLTFQTGPSSAVAQSGIIRDVSNPVSSESALNRALDGDMQRVLAALPKINAPLATSLQKNLRIVDNLIAVCEKSVREQPQNPLAREYLYGAVQQKAVLLSAAMDRSTLEDR